jgi:hypothetical protein
MLTFRLRYRLTSSKLKAVETQKTKYGRRSEKMIDFSKLRGRIVEKYGSVGAFAGAVEMSRAQVSHKLNGRADFNSRDIIKWCDVLEIEPGEVYDYFFTRKVN